MPTRWSYDPEIPAADIMLRPETAPIAYPVRTIDLHGAHVLLDVDSDGNPLSLEILGPCDEIYLADLGTYLKTEANS